MNINREQVRKLLREANFKALFLEELGWDRHRADHLIELNGRQYNLSAIAEKRGVQAFHCHPDGQGHIPNYPIRRRLDHELRKIAHEHLIIYTDSTNTNQRWQWVAREPGKPALNREWVFDRNSTGEALIQKLETIAFTLSDEEALTVTGVTVRLKDAFDKDRVTKRFYDRFKKELEGFIKFIKGIPTADWDKWYASVTINRLMFIYFLQKKGFLNNDQDYLRHQLEQSKARGRDHYYRDFLCPLFFEGFARKPKDRNPPVRTLLGKVPYLNGGLFLKHWIEETHGTTIQIPDDAFARLFAFFDQYQWHLDDRPLRADNEINPEVLGYIFEKYTNQKQMGAYYTKEDITDYIGKNTIIPYLLDEARRECRIAFEPDGSVWRLLRIDPDRYIYPAVRKGVIDDKGEVIPESVLPDFVQTGMHDPKARMFDKRYNLGDARGNVETLPTETWREYVERRKRCLELRAKLTAGEVHDVNDLITYNLNIRQFAQDVVESCEGPELLRALWKAIREVSVLDPTCGSGAFLFAALNILEPLYDACLTRMQAFVEELDSSGIKHSPEKFGDFRKALAQIGQHPNRRYFVLKSIIIGNLYGVDIMDEAVEICKLRFFLKLVAQLESPDNIEPLPDIDFNIKAGNTLVGYATAEDVKKAMTGTTSKQSGLVFDETAYRRFEEKVQDIEALVNLFRQQQTELGGEITGGAKEKLSIKLKVVEDELNRYLATEYGIDWIKDTDYKRWLESHKPFHWFIEFYGILSKGGFDAIIGNPPYVELSSIRGDYSTVNLTTRDCGNLYPLVIERSYSVLGTNNRFGMIVPLSAFCTDRMNTMQTLMIENSGPIWLSHYAERPSKLFEGAERNLTICLSKTRSKDSENSIYSTPYIKWGAAQRSQLFGLLFFVCMTDTRCFGILPKVGTKNEVSALGKINSQPSKVAQSCSLSPTKHLLYYRNSGGRYWKIISDFQPAFYSNGKRSVSSRESYLYFMSETNLRLAISILNSSTYYWYYVMNSDARTNNPSDLKDFPFGFELADAEVRKELIKLCRILMQDYADKAVLQDGNYRTGRIQFQKFYPARSKPIIDEIDQVLARHYGFTDEELDYIINYDIKYRMGRGAGDEDE